MLVENELKKEKKRKLTLQKELVEIFKKYKSSSGNDQAEIKIIIIVSLVKNHSLINLIKDDI